MAHSKANKKGGPFGGIHLKAKKARKVKGYYRSTLTGNRVY